MRIRAARVQKAWRKAASHAKPQSCKKRIAGCFLCGLGGLARDIGCALESSEFLKERLAELFRIELKRGKHEKSDVSDGCSGGSRHRMAGREWPRDPSDPGPGAGARRPTRRFPFCRARR